MIRCVLSLKVTHSAWIEVSFLGLTQGIGAYLLRGLGDYVGDNAYGQGFNLRVEPYVGSSECL
jgi:hypothetical protein